MAYRYKRTKSGAASPSLFDEAGASDSRHCEALSTSSLRAEGEAISHQSVRTGQAKRSVATEIASQAAQEGKIAMTASASAPVWQVGELTQALKSTIERTFPLVTVEGELSNVCTAASGHLYFTLKDSSAQIRAVMFRSRAAYLNFRPRDGLLVRLQGSVTVYPPRGEYQITVTRMRMAGAGDILQMLEELKRRLSSEGLFTAERKKPLPRFPRTVGVITSPTGAALRDILQIAKRRNPRINIVILPASVQGSNAKREIIKQIRCANAFRLCDILIVGRGGGSIEDLLPFSDEAVVRAVAASRIPTISAVGHEIDWALCDYAADYRAPTPSAAAERAVPQLTDINDMLEDKRLALYNGVRYALSRARLLVQTFSEEAMELRLRSIEQPLIARIDAGERALRGAMMQRLSTYRQRVALAKSALDNANPQVVLDRGYSIVRLKATGAVLRNASDTAAGDALDIRLGQGNIAAEVV